MRKSIYIVAISILILMTSITVKASETRNIEQMTRLECENTIYELVKAICNNDNSFMIQNSDMFDSNTYNSLDEYIRTNDIGTDLSNITIEFTYPDNSSCGDSVIMVNFVTWKENKEYNLAYLFEFHVDAYGDIYGYNIWVY